MRIGDGLGCRHFGRGLVACKGAAAFAGLVFLLGNAPADANQIVPVTPTVTVAPGVTQVHFPATSSTASSVSGLRLDALLSLRPSVSKAAPSGSATSSTLQGSSYYACQPAADAPPQEIIDLAKALNGGSTPTATGWINIFQYVHNKIDLEPSAASTKGALGTYLDQSGGSFDQASLLVSLLRSAGYTAQFVVGTAALTAAQMGLSSLPQQLILDGGGSSNGTMSYAWVQIQLNNQWLALDPANKSYTILSGANLSQWISAPIKSGTSGSAITSALGTYAQAIYTSTNAATQNHESVTTFIGGRRMNSNFSTNVANITGTIGTGGIPYQYLPVPSNNPGSVPSNRTGFIVGANNSPGNMQSSTNPSSGYICLDQIYGHDVAYRNNALYVDNLLVQSGFSSPVWLTVWEAPDSNYSQAIQETFSSINAIFNFGVGHVGQFRAQHDANASEAVGATLLAPANSQDLAMIAASSSQLSQTSRTSELLDQLAGTYTMVHHVVQIIRANNTVDTPLTSTSVDGVNSAPASGLVVSPQALTYALSAVQSAQEATALLQSGATQPVSSAGLLSALTNSTATQFLPHTGGSVSSGYSYGQLQVLQNYVNNGYDLVIPASAPGATAPLGFLAMNSVGTSAFVLNTADGSVYKGAANLGAVSNLGAIGTGGTAAEAGATAAGLNIDPSSGEVTFAAPLISIGSAAPYKLEFDLLYSSRPDAQPTSSPQLLTGRPEASGFAHNFDIRATASSDGLSLVGSDLTGAALPGIVAAYELLESANTIATYYASGGIAPTDAAYQDAVIANWLTTQGTNNVVTIQQGLTNTVFARMPDGSFHTPQPSGATLTQSNSAYTMTTAQGDVFAFNASDGQIGTITTPDGVVTTFSYTSLLVGPSPSVSVNLLSKVQLGTHSLTFGYVNSSAGTNNIYVLQSVEDETNRTTSLHYGNCFNSLPNTPVPQLCGGTKPDWCCGNAWAYAFNFGQPAVGTDSFQAILLKGVVIANPAQNGDVTTSVAYDGARLMPTGMTNANNHTTSYYLAPGRWQITDALGNISYGVSGPVQYQGGDDIVSYSYDALGNQTTAYSNYVGQLLYKSLPNTQSGYQSAYTYDAHGNPASTTIGAITTSTVWDQTWNKPTQVTDPLGNVTTYTYNQAGSTAPGTLAKVVHPAVTYNGASQNPTETFTYNANGQVLTATAADGEVTAYGYSATTHDLTTVTTDSGASPHLNLTTTYGYDTVGNVYSVTDPRGYNFQANFDGARRMLHSITPPISAQGNGIWSTFYTYDLNGRLIQKSQDPGGGQPAVVINMTYDAVGNLLTQSEPTNSGTVRNTVYTYDADERVSTVTDPAGQVVTTTYDADSRPYQTLMNGTVTQTHSYTGDGLPAALADGNGHSLTYSYDAYDRLTKTGYTDGTSETLVLDNASRVTTSTNRGGLQTAFTYDAMNRVTKETDQSFSAPFTTTYDLAGRPLTVTYSAGTFTYQYDSAGRQSATTRPDGLAIKYAYDADGNDAAITYPDNFTYSYAYDELDRMTNVSETPAGSTTVTSLAHYTYDPLSRRTTLTYANGASTAYSYDAFSGLSQIAHTFADTGKLPTATFTYTRDNNERRVGDTVSNTAYLWHPPATATDSYTPNSLNQYTAINGQTLSYDPNGNLLGDPTAALGSTSYQFDQKNRLTAATNAQYTSTYTYDPFSRRASKTVNGVTTFFVDDGNREIADYSSPTSEISHYIYGADSTPIMREVFDGAPTVQGSYWVHTDALGSLVAISNLNGSHTSTYNYSAFGETSSVANAIPYQYAGMRLDPETMLYYDHARYYSPKQGRFISPDPISVKGGVNIYAYAGNDPVNGVDTTGLDATGYDEGDNNDPFGGSCNICIIGSQTLFFGGNLGAHVGGDIWAGPGAAADSGNSSSSSGSASSSDSSASAAASSPSAGGVEGQPTSVSGGAGDTDVGSPAGAISSTGGASGSDASGNACLDAGNYCTGVGNTITLYRNPLSSINDPYLNAALGFAAGPLLIAAIGESAPLLGEQSFFRGTYYSQKVLAQAARGAGEFHSFPDSVAAFEESGTVTKIVGGDGKAYTSLKIPGSYQGTNGNWYDGFFHFIKDEAGQINHRLFEPR